jgi:hypothetical protein
VLKKLTNAWGIKVNAFAGDALEYLTLVIAPIIHYTVKFILFFYRKYRLELFRLMLNS